MCHTDVFYVNESTKVNEPVAHAPVLSTAPVPPASDEPGSGVPFAATIYKQHCPKSDLKARRVGHEDASNLANNSHRTGARQLHLVQIQPIRLRTLAQHEIDVGSAPSPITLNDLLQVWRIRAPCDRHVVCSFKPHLPLHVHALWRRYQNALTKRATEHVVRETSARKKNRCYEAPALETQTHMCRQTNRSSSCSSSSSSNRSNNRNPRNSTGSCNRSIVVVVVVVIISIT